jgi:hypothetical protein
MYGLQLSVSYWSITTLYESELFVAETEGILNLFRGLDLDEKAFGLINFKS